MLKNSKQGNNLKINVQVRVRYDQRRFLVELANERDISVSALLRDIIDEMIMRRKTVEEYR